MASCPGSSKHIKTCHHEPARREAEQFLHVERLKPRALRLELDTVDGCAGGDVEH
jgi:hypothetical protein